MLIPYGAARLSPRFFDVVRDTDGREHVRCRIAHVAIPPERREPLRLSDAGGLVRRPVAAPDQVDAADRVSLLRAEFENLCGLWWPVGRRFVSRYFELVAHIVEEHRRELESRLAAFGALYHYRDWIHSAPAPLPRAWIPVPGAQQSTPAPDSFVACDFAFWTGDEIVAVYVPGVETATPERRASIERLRGAGVRVHEVPAAVLSGRGADALRDLLPAESRRFWEGERYPSGPSWTDMAGIIEDPEA